MIKILTLDKIEAAGLVHLPPSKYSFGTDLEAPDGIILRSNNLHTKEFSANTMAIARAGAGVNNIPVDRCTQQGIVVFNTPGANANGVKELIIAGLLLASRDISGGIQWAKTLIGQGEQVPSLVEKGKANFAGSEIGGKTLTVIGLGAIGVLVANAALSLGMKVIGYDPYLSVSRAQKLNMDIQLSFKIESAIANADFISINVPLSGETKGFFNKDKFSLMKRGAKLLNFARGELVCLSDLEAAIEEGIVACYVTDFPNEETLKMKNTICIPHLGASTAESEMNCVTMAADQLLEYFEKGNIINSVNFPNMEMEMSGGMRLVVANKNIPALVSQISAVLAEEGLNILNMMNKNKVEIAYNIIDVDKAEISESALNKLKAIEGVFMVRTILNS
ncbi:MAG TPA: 3-phosphoglycerate dehydrogenase family protein [Prolixibacteraceae bacterium]|nr:3-phosphoglycerate dehydrogenase family protein [Prolixibacteraceae bacterium]